VKIHVACLLASIASPLAAEETIDQLFERGLALYPQCVVSEALRLDDRKEPAETIASAALSSCREARAGRVELVANMLIYKTPGIPRTEEQHQTARQIAEEKTAEFDLLLKDRAVLRILEARKKKH
jgi:hypothetical protein